MLKRANDMHHSLLNRGWSLSWVASCAVCVGFLALDDSSAHAQVRFPAGPPGRFSAPQNPNYEHLPAARRDAADDAEDDDPEKNLPEYGRNVYSLPTTNASIEVIHRRSQLIVFKERVVRIAITDPNVADYVMYSEKEVGVIGNTIGTTTLTVWFEKEDETVEPLIYLIKVIRDPGLEEIARIDYGKLEKKLLILFPNSKVYLIPMSGKIIVRGQARDSQEAAWIMQIIRGEFINQFGGLGGPGSFGLNNAGFAGGAAYGAAGALGGGFGGLNGGFGNGLGANGMFSMFIINQLTIPGDFQLSLRVRIVELNRSQLRRMGVDLTININDGQTVLRSLMSGGAANLNGVFSEDDVTVAINALKSYGTAQILTEPNLTVLSGHDATILSGGEFAVPTIVGINGVGGQQTVFRGFGTSLLVTPTVIDKDLIRMRIRPEFSEINGQNGSGGVPGLSTRRVDTTVELREGQTLVLGGLLSYRARTQVAAVPVLGSIPLVGPLLFQTKQGNHDETELLVLVTPEIVRPMEADEVPPVPGFEVVHPNDYSLLWKGFTQDPNDTTVNQLPPYGQGSGVGIPIGYGQFNPNPASPMYSPAPGGVGAGGFSPPAAGYPYGGGAPGGGYPAGGYPGGNYQNGGGYPNGTYPTTGLPGSNYAPNRYMPPSRPGSPASLPNGNGNGYLPPPNGPTASRTSSDAASRRWFPNLRGPSLGGTASTTPRGQGPNPYATGVQPTGYTMPRR